MHMRTTLSELLLATAVLWIAACSSGTPAPPSQKSAATSPAATVPNEQQAATHTVVISGFKFQPAEMTVRAGDTVEWKNMDSMPHNAVASDKSFDSGKLKTGMTGKIVADEKTKGTHDYICTYHPNMKAKLIVQ